MKSKFQCLNCGKCCNSYHSQINVTTGDIIRISNFIKKPVRYILNNFIGINAFGDPENPTKFSYELGINMPCSLRKNERCSLHNARPLNCRLFPYWILVYASKSGKKEIIDNSYECMRNLNLNSEELKKYYNYVKVIGNVLMEEGKLTDDILNSLGIKHPADLSGNKDYKKIVEKYKNTENINDFKRLEEEKIKLAKRIFGKLNEAQINLIEKKLENKNLIENIRKNTEEIKRAEEILD